MGLPPASANSAQSFYAEPDATAWLPESAATKLQRLRQRVADQLAVCPSFEETHAANTAKAECQRRIDRLLEHPSRSGFGLHPNDPRVEREREQLRALTAEAERLSDLDRTRGAAWRAASGALSAVEAWLRGDGRPGGTVLEAVEIEAPKLAKGENSILDGIENRRRRVRELKADINRISSSPFPSAFCKQQAREQIQVLAQRGAVNVSRLVEHNGDVEFPTMQVSAMVHNATPGAVAFLEAPDAVALLAWLHKPALIAAIEREIDSESDDSAALSVEVRQRQEAVVLADLLAVEREECALVWKALAQNLPVEFRSDTNPAAILQCRLIAAPPTNPSPGSGVEHAFDVVGGWLRRR